jgi:hypothetical protein
MNPLVHLLAEFGSVEKTVISVLSVSGGFLLGHLLTGLTVHLIAKFMLKKQAPPRLTQFARLAGGAGAAIAVYLMLAGQGGFGFGGSGGEGNGLLNVNSGTDNKTPAKQVEPDSAPKSKEKDEDVRGKPLSVFILGPGAPDQKYFRFEDDPQPLTDDEIVQRIEHLDKAGQIKVKQIRIKAGTDKPSAQHYSRLYSKLMKALQPLGFEIIPLNG